MTITVPKSGKISLNKFKNLLDISKVEWYSLKEKDGCLILQFYDKNGKVIKLYASEKKEKTRSKKIQTKS